MHDGYNLVTLAQFSRSKVNKWSNLSQSLLMTTVTPEQLGGFQQSLY